MESSVLDPWHIGTDPDPYRWLTDPAQDPDPVFFRQWLTRCQQKINISSKFFAPFIFEHQCTLKSKNFFYKNSTGSNQGFSYFLLINRRIRIRIRPNNDGSESPSKRTDLQIRVHNTGGKTETEREGRGGVIIAVSADERGGDGDKGPNKKATSKKHRAYIAYLLPSSMMPDSLSFSISSSISSVSSCAILKEKEQYWHHPTRQCWGSVTFWCGSATLWLTNSHPDEDPAPFFSDFRDAKNFFFHIFFLVTYRYLPTGTLSSVFINFC